MCLLFTVTLGYVGYITCFKLSKVDAMLSVTLFYINLFIIKNYTVISFVNGLLM